MEGTFACSPAVLTDLSRKILAALGVPPHDAEVVAASLVDADMQGVSSHGVVRLQAYAQRITAGGLNPRAEIRLIRENATWALLDADNGFGQVAASAAARLAVDKAAQTGVGLVSVRRSNHFGRAGYYSEWIARQGMIGISMSNASPRLAPWGGRRPLLGNNPWSVAIPTTGEPLVLDMANSVVAAGRIRQAAQKGERIPEGWALDAEGRPTTDPVEALKGVLLPFGTYKGYGITLLVGILTGVLSGGGWDVHVRPIDALSEPQGESHLLAAISVRDMMPEEVFRQRVAEVIRQIKECPPAEGSPGVFLPGEIEHERRSRAEKEGIPLALATWEAILRLAKSLGVPVPEGCPANGTGGGRA